MHSRAITIWKRMHHVINRSTSLPRAERRVGSAIRRVGSAIEQFEAQSSTIRCAEEGRRPRRRGSPRSCCRCCRSRFRPLAYSSRSRVATGEGVDWVDWGGLGGLCGQPWAAQGWDTGADGEATARKRFAGMLWPSKLEITHD